MPFQRFVLFLSCACETGALHVFETVSYVLGPTSNLSCLFVRFRTALSIFDGVYATFKANHCNCQLLHDSVSQLYNLGDFSRMTSLYDGARPDD